MFLEAAEDETGEPDDERQVTTELLEDFVEGHALILILLDCLRLDELDAQRLKLELVERDVWERGLSSRYLLGLGGFVAEAEVTELRHGLVAVDHRVWFATKLHPKSIVEVNPIGEGGLDLLHGVLVEHVQLGGELEGLLLEDGVHLVVIVNVGLRREELSRYLRVDNDVAEDCEALILRFARGAPRDRLQLLARVHDEVPGVLQVSIRYRCLAESVR